MGYAVEEKDKFSTIPSDYPVYEIGHNIAIMKQDQDLSNPSVRASLKYFKVVNRKPTIKDTRAIASADLPTAGNSVDLAEKTSWKDWLKSSKGTLYVFRVGFQSDKQTEWEVRYPTSTQTGVTKSSPDLRWTSDDSPFWNPRLTVFAWEEEFPTFKVWNKSQETLGEGLVLAKGYKYSLVELKGEPSTPVNYIVLGDVNTN